VPGDFERHAEAITQEACVKRKLLKYLGNFDLFRVTQVAERATFFAEGALFYQRFLGTALAHR
jgi:hypothetical protein